MDIIIIPILEELRKSSNLSKNPAELWSEPNSLELNSHDFTHPGCFLQCPVWGKLLVVAVFAQETRLLKKERQINNLPPERWEEISWIRFRKFKRYDWDTIVINDLAYPVGYRLILALEVAFPLTWLLLLLLQYNPSINKGRSLPTHLYQNEFACKTWVLLF